MPNSPPTGRRSTRSTAKSLRNLNARAKHAQAIGKLKEGTSAYRPEREAQVLAALAAVNAGPLPDAAVTGVFRQVMSACLALEQKLKVAYLGPAGTFSHAAVARHFGSFVDMVPLATIDEIFRAVESGQATTRWCRSRIPPKARSDARSISCA